jgi:anhydro-N-acetylmuramic acid kinase
VASLWIGLMSGTSADAVDAALVRIPDEPSGLALVARASVPLSDELRARIHGALGGPLALRELVRLDVELGERFAGAALEVLRTARVDPREVEGIGSHGQTIGHFPEPEVRGTLQIGSAARIHARTGIPVVHDFRRADMAAGGQGAPLTPFAHHALFARDGEMRAVLNIGGFTNVTYLPGRDPARAIAFDPGPGNALLDGAVRRLSGGRERFDRDGARAARGRVLTPALDALLEEPYFALPPPKSTGHERFGAAFLERAERAVREAGGGDDDLLATLAALTVASVARAAERFFPAPAARWLLCGGGAANPVLVGGLRRALGGATVETTAQHGIPVDALEAIAFALLGWVSARGLPGNLPVATGAKHAVVLGAAVPPHAFGGLGLRMHR